MAKIVINFAHGGNSDRFVRSGFSQSEAMGRWTEGETSTLEIDGLLAGGSGQIRLRFGPYTAPPTVPNQRLMIQVGDRLIFEKRISQNSDETIPLPPHAIDASGTLRLKFVHLDCVSPKAAGLSNDGRRLGFVFWDLAVDDQELPPSPPAAVLPAVQVLATQKSEPRVAAVTMVYNESEYLPIWLSHYGKQVGLENCFVVDHGSDDGSVDSIGPASRIRLPRSPYDPHRQSDFNSKFCNSLLEWYDWVIYSDVDEIAFVDPLISPSFREYCKSNLPPVVTAIGLNVIHRAEYEPPLDPGRPIAPQRPYVFFGSSMCKPLLISRDINWSPGSHSSDAPMAFDHLYMFHLRWYDFGSCMRRLQKTRAMAWARTDAGVHQRVDDESMRRQFVGFARLPAIDGVQFSPVVAPISDYLRVVTESHVQRKRDLYKLDLNIWGQQLWRVPDRFRIF